MDRGDEAVRRALKWLAALVAVLLVALLLLRTPDTDRKAMIAKYGAPPSQFVELRPGLTVHFRDEGPRDAPVIVLLHGSNADLHTWDAWTAALTDRYRVVRFDQIGHGLTGADPRGDYAPQNFAVDVGRIADRLGLKRFVLAGNSMGGGIALDYALRHPDRLAGLVLVDSAGAPQNGTGPSNIGFKIAATPGLNRIMTIITPRWVVAQSMEQAVARKEAASETAIDRVWELLRYPGNREATRLRITMPRTSFDPAKLASLHVATLILWGDDDRQIPVESGRWLAEAIPGSQLIVYPGIGHIPMEEAAAQSVGDLRGWLAELKPG